VTLFALLIVMALERVVTKSKQFHITTLARRYFHAITNNKILRKNGLHDDAGTLVVVLIALVPAAIASLLLALLPTVLDFIFLLTVLWVCLGSPLTRQIYKRYLQAAQREDLQACALHSMAFGNEGGELSNVGKQLVLINYRQFASVIIVFILLGVPGVIFYCLIKEWVLYQKQQQQKMAHRQAMQSDDAEQSELDDFASVEEQAEIIPVNDQTSRAATLLFLLDWVPVRITTFGFLVVGHFSNALSAWFDIVMNPSISTYDALAKVSKAAEDVGDCDVHLSEPLALVKLVKRNIIFILATLAILTLVGLVA
jgi:AmpE protein